MQAAIQKKVCMVGSYGVGKTSLVRRFVESIFSDSYLSNVGVKIDKKTVHAGGVQVNMVLWDLAGEDEITRLRASHLRGASGYILVADGCRAATLDKAIELQERLRDALDGVSFVLALNKYDLLKEWEIGSDAESELARRSWRCFKTSAKSGDAVEQLFLTLATDMLKSHS